MDKKDLMSILVLVVVSYILIFLIPPMDFPLSDDYAYYSEVKTFLEEGRIAMHRSATATSIVQVLIGSAASTILGLSHKTLMLTTMLISVIPIVFTYIWLRLWSGRLVSFLGSILFLLNPTYYYHSHTFMTDIYALTFMVPSLYFLYVGVRRRDDRFLAAGIALSLAGFWVRQYSILLVGGSILWYIYRILVDRKNEFTLKRILMLIVIPAINMLVWWMLFPILHDLEHKCVYVLGIGGWVPKNMLQALLFTGYFIFLMGIAYLLRAKDVMENFRGLNKYVRAFLVLVFAVLILFMVLRTLYGLGNLWVPAMPFAYATANPNGIGPAPIAGSKPNLFPIWLWWPICILSVIAAFGISVSALRKLNDRMLILLLAFIFSFIVPQTFYGNFFDRYYMLIIPMVLPIVFSSIKSRRILISCLLVSAAVSGFWSYYGVYDHFSWNSARWEGINYLLSMGVQDWEIDGGMEYNARFFQGCQNIDVKPVRWYGWAYSISDRYVVSLSPLDGYDVMKEIPYTDAFGWEAGRVYILKKSF